MKQQTVVKAGYGISTAIVKPIIGTTLIHSAFHGYKKTDLIVLIGEIEDLEIDAANDFC